MTLSLKILIGLMIVTSILIATHAFLFQAGLSGGEDFQQRFAEIPLYAAFHVLGSGVALLIGGFQFLPRLRARRIQLHRWLGRAYLIAVLIGGVGGIVMAGRADGGLGGQFGFFLLGVVWLVSGWQAYAAIRRGDIQAHRVWMIRNFALTFAAVTLRIYLGASQAVFGLSFAEFYPAVAWLCWVPNLIVAEWLIVAMPKMAWGLTKSSPDRLEQGSQPS
jgi:uncharacterized membrane protein